MHAKIKNDCNLHAMVGAFHDSGLRLVGEILRFLHREMWFGGCLDYQICLLELLARYCYDLQIWKTVTFAVPTHLCSPSCNHRIFAMKGKGLNPSVARMSLTRFSVSASAKDLWGRFLGCSEILRNELFLLESEDLVLNNTSQRMWAEQFFHISNDPFKEILDVITIRPPIHIRAFSHDWADDSPSSIWLLSRCQMPAFTGTVMSPFRIGSRICCPDHS